VNSDRSELRPSGLWVGRHGSELAKSASTPKQSGVGTPIETDAGLCLAGETIPKGEVRAMRPHHWEVAENSGREGT